MQAGRLRHRVTILNFASFRDTTGQPVEEWQEERPYGRKCWVSVVVSSCNQEQKRHRQQFGCGSVSGVM